MKKRERLVSVFSVLVVVGFLVLPLAGMAAQEQPTVKAVYALKYADLPPMGLYMAFWLGPRFLPDMPQTMSGAMYYYLIKTDTQNILVDVGITPDLAVARKIANYIPPDELLGRLGVKISDINSIIVSHGHWDHADALEMFPKSTIYMQRECYRWMVEGGPEFSVFRRLGYPDKKLSFSMLTLMWNGQLRLVDGNAELFPGIKVLKLDGHHVGLQSTVIATEGKPIVLMSDNVYFYENLEKDHPIGTFTGSLADIVKGVETLRRINGVLVPSHDPKVMDRFKPVDKAIVQIYP
jgi:glyoxylase-like metal-dependent hydrolase (beta-lactamase superfamily II)